MGQVEVVVVVQEQTDQIQYFQLSHLLEVAVVEHMIIHKEIMG